MIRVLAAAFAVLFLPPHLPAQQSVPEWSLTPELRIGAVDGPNALDVVGSIVVSPRSGNIFVEESSQQISAFSADGRRLRSFGRRGDGPGEFQNLNDIYWSDSLIVAIDGPTHQVTHFTEEGEVIDTRRIESAPLVDSPLRAGAIAPLGNGYFLGITPGRAVHAGQLIRFEYQLLRMDGAGDDSVLDQLADRSGRIEMLKGTARIMIPVPMLPGALHGVHPHGAAIAIVHQNSPTDDETGGFRVRKIGNDAREIFARNYAYSPRPLPRGYLRKFIDNRRRP